MLVWDDEAMGVDGMGEDPIDGGDVVLSAGARGRGGGRGRGAKRVGPASSSRKCFASQCGNNKKTN
eukprot:9176719-Pyramimonas_sp.AAC.1